MLVKPHLRFILVIAFAAIFAFSATMLILYYAQGVKEETALKQLTAIIAVFESQIYRKSDKVFKHYNFLNAEGQTDFDEYIANIKALSLYDTGVTASCGDELLTLVTCAYHTENGQFVVVARKVG